MAEMTTIELTTLLPDEILHRLRDEAQHQQISLPELVREAIETYLEELEVENIEETPDEQVLSDFRESWHAAMTGQTRPAREVLAEIREE